MYKLTVDDPGMARGTKVQIDGLGEFENGYTYEIDAVLADGFRARHQVITSKTDKDGNMTTEVSPGPTLLQFFKSSKVVTVERSESEKDSVDGSNNDSEKGGGE